MFETLLHKIMRGESIAPTETGPTRKYRSGAFTKKGNRQAERIRIWASRYPEMKFLKILESQGIPLTKPQRRKLSA